jgi:hypothetical protein
MHNKGLPMLGFRCSTWVLFCQPLECRRNGKEDHEASGLRVARAEKAWVPGLRVYG